MLFASTHVPTKHPDRRGEGGRHRRARGRRPVRAERRDGLVHARDGDVRRPAARTRRPLPDGRGVDRDLPEALARGDLRLGLRVLPPAPGPGASGHAERPNPVLVSAGNSPAGQAFSAKYCDFNFITFGTFDEARQISRNVRRMAREDYGRDTGIMTYGYLICRDTEQEARKARDLMMEHADWGAANNVLAAARRPRRAVRHAGRVDAGALHPRLGRLSVRRLAGAGRPRRSSRRATPASTACVFGLLDYAEELEYLERALLPLMREAGLRVT